MKEIKAYIQKHKLDDVIRALHRIEGLTGMSVTDFYGYGIGWARIKAPEQAGFQTGVKLEIICRDSLADEVIAAIEKAAHTGLKGDGKIYMSATEQAVRISTGERGERAV
jgi:nitrogen regulatory protein PII